MSLSKQGVGRPSKSRTGCDSEQKKKAKHRIRAALSRLGGQIEIWGCSDKAVSHLQKEMMRERMIHNPHRDLGNKEKFPVVLRTALDEMVKDGELTLVFSSSNITDMRFVLRPDLMRKKGQQSKKAASYQNRGKRRSPSKEEKKVPRTNRHFRGNPQVARRAAWEHVTQGFVPARNTDSVDDEPYNGDSPTISIPCRDSLVYYRIPSSI